MRKNGNISYEDGVVTDVAIDGSAETADVGGAAIPVLAEAILAAQSPYVDAVGGASFTSAAVLTAAEKAEDGSWNVICTKEDNGTLTVNAKAVITSTGSFAGNEEMMREALGDDVYEAAFVIGGCDGTGLQMLYDNGAAKGELLTMNHGVGPRAASTPDGGGIKVAAYGNVEGVGLSTALTTGRLAGRNAAEFAAK